MRRMQGATPRSRGRTRMAAREEVLYLEYNDTTDRTPAARLLEGGEVRQVLTTAASAARLQRSSARRPPWHPHRGSS